MILEKNPTLIRILLLRMGALFVVATMIIIVFINIQMRKQALVEAESKALLLLDHNLAIHAYFSHQLKPKMFETFDSFMPETYFEPVWMSSTFAVRGIMEHFQKIDPTDYYYKEGAINARSVLNEADEYEQKFLREIKNDPKLQTRTSVRTVDGKEYFTLLRRGETMEASCIRCHRTPDEAPASMVALYGPERSFSRSVGDIVSVVSIRVPLSEAYASANLFSLHLSILLVFVLLGMFVVIFWITRRYALTPLLQVKDAALLIADSPQQIGEMIDKPKGRELGELVAAFNKMSSSLKQSHDGLEQQVVERTEELTKTNRVLMEERDNLKKAAAEIKTLRGILPICASCKKIRDDDGYWNQIETYIHARSEADFTHSICPECAKKLYPDVDL